MGRAGTTKQKQESTERRAKIIDFVAFALRHTCKNPLHSVNVKQFGLLRNEEEEGLSPNSGN